MFPHQPDIPGPTKGILGQALRALNVCFTYVVRIGHPTNRCLCKQVMTEADISFRFNGVKYSPYPDVDLKQIIQWWTQPSQKIKNCHALAISHGSGRHGDQHNSCMDYPQFNPLNDLPFSFHMHFLANKFTLIFQ